MPHSKSRFVTACQQLLALGVVLAALTPAASVVSLDVVRQTPLDGTAGAPALAADLSAYTRATLRPSTVPAQVVDPEVDEYSLTPASGSKSRLGAAARSKADAVRAQTSDTVTSTPEPVVGYGAVGVTWAPGTNVPEDQIGVQVRTRTGQEWSDWMKVDYDPEHGPDPASAEARQARPGTDALLVGDVDQVQVRAESEQDALPPDLKLAVVDPGAPARTAVEKPALDTSTMDPAGSTGSTGSTGTPESAGVAAEIATDAGEGTDGTDRIDLRAAAFTPKPVIYSRSQWGADERMRSKSSLHYGEVHAGFVHHTVNANDYTRAEVPGILRSIYAYHTRSRGWSDIGYNYLVDRFGRIWEGRYGGVDRPVVGAHTLNYNDYSFAMSAIGNYDVKRPSSAMVQAYGALFAWKLSLHGVSASSTRQWVGSRYFKAINGHRDAASTACPGRYLYAKIPQIRTLAARAQRGWSGRELESDLASTAHPDLIVRRASDGKAFILPTGGMTGVAKARSAQVDLADGDTVLASPDLTGDGRGDLVVRSSSGAARVLPGDGGGRFGAGIRSTGSLAGHDLVTAVGDLDGNGDNDLVARWPASGRLDAYLGDGDGSFRVKHMGKGWGGYNLVASAGDLTGDGRVDLVARDTKGSLWLVRGMTGPRLASPVRLAGSWKGYSTITGYGDFTGDGRGDLFVRTAKTHYGYVRPFLRDGTFGHGLGPITRVRGARSIVGAAQVTGDAKPDLVARTGQRLTIFRNRGTVETRTPIATGVDLSSANLVLNAGDWDRDGHGDMISRSKASGSLYVRRGDGTGHFGKSKRIGQGFGNVRLLTAVGDMTGDGFPDLMGQPASGDMRIYPGRGLAGLRASYVAHRRISATDQVALGRWNGDGAPDTLLRVDNRATLYPGNGPGGLTKPKSLGLSLAPYDWVIGISDEGLSGHPDVVVREKKTGLLWLLPGTTTGFGPRRLLAEGMSAYNLSG